MSTTKYNKTPYIELKNDYNCYVGWKNICNQILKDVKNCKKTNSIIVVECYQGVYYEQIQKALFENLSPELFI